MLSEIGPGKERPAGEFVRRVRGEFELKAEKERAKADAKKSLESAVRALDMQGDVAKAKKMVNSMLCRLPCTDQCSLRL